MYRAEIQPIYIHPTGNITDRIDPVCKLPYEICLIIFSYLSSVDLRSCAFTCKTWQDQINDSKLWKPRLLKTSGAKFLEILEPLIKQDCLSWRLGSLFAKLLPILEVFQQEVQKCKDLSQKRIITYYNFNQQHSYMINIVPEEVPRSYVKSEGWEFCSNPKQQQILVKNNNHLKYLLKSNEERSYFYCHLTKYGPYLFALGSDGRVVQLKYETGKVLHIYDTAWSTDHSGLSKLKKQPFKKNFCKGLFVNLEYMVLVFGEIKSPFFQVISLIGDKKQWFIQNMAISEPTNVHVYNNMLFVQMQCSTFVWDLLANKHLGTIDYTHLRGTQEEAYRLGVNNNHILTWTSDKKLYVHDRKTLNLVTFCSISESGMCAGIIRNLAFLFKGIEGIKVIDLNKDKLVGTIKITLIEKTYEIFQKLLSTHAYRIKKLQIPQSRACMVS